MVRPSNVPRERERGSRKENSTGSSGRLPRAAKTHIRNVHINNSRAVSLFIKLNQESADPLKRPECCDTADGIGCCSNQRPDAAGLEPLQSSQQHDAQ